MSFDRGWPSLSLAAYSRRMNSASSWPSNNSPLSAIGGRTLWISSKRSANSCAQAEVSLGLAIWRPSTKLVINPGVPRSSPVSSLSMGCGTGTPKILDISRARKLACAHLEANSGSSTKLLMTSLNARPVHSLHSTTITSFVNAPKADPTDRRRLPGTASCTIACNRSILAIGNAELRTLSEVEGSKQSGIRRHARAAELRQDCPPNPCRRPPPWWPAGFRGGAIASPA